MKRYLAFLTIALALAACTKQPDGSKYLPAPLLETSTGTVQFDALGGSAQLSVVAQSAVTASVAGEWLSVVVEGQSVSVTAVANPSIESRYATLKLDADGKSRNVQVIQFGFNSKYIWDDSYSFTYDGGSLELPYLDTGTPARVKVSVDWIFCAAENGIFTITVAGNPDKEAREGAIECAFGDDVRNIAIFQAKNPGGSSGDDDVVRFSEDFEDVSTVNDWVLYDVDGDEYCWSYSNQLTAHSGSGLLFSQSYINDEGPLTPDNWVFTPAIKFTTDNYLSFWVTAQDKTYVEEHYAVYITSALPTDEPNPSSMTTLMETTFPDGDPAARETIEEHEYQQFVIKIPTAFANKTGYIAFRHFECTDMFYLNLDDVMVTKGKPSASAVFAAPACATTAPDAKRK